MPGEKFKVVGFGKIARLSMEPERKIFAEHKVDVETIEARVGSENELIASPKMSMRRWGRPTLYPESH